MIDATILTDAEIRDWNYAKGWPGSGARVRDETVRRIADRLDAALSLAGDEPIRLAVLTSRAEGEARG